MGETGEAQGPPPPAEPIDFTLERERHERFVRRKGLLVRFNDWLLGPDDMRWAVVTGGPGMGQSALSSTWLVQREAEGPALPHHFVGRQVSDWDQPEVIAGSLTVQIEATSTSSATPKRNRRAGSRVAWRGIKAHLRVGRLVIVVDGLDETRAAPERIWCGGFCHMSESGPVNGDLDLSAAEPDRGRGPQPGPVRGGDALPTPQPAVGVDDERAIVGQPLVEPPPMDRGRALQCLRSLGSTRLRVADDSSCSHCRPKLLWAHHWSERAKLGSHL